MFLNNLFVFLLSQDIVVSIISFRKNRHEISTYPNTRIQLEENKALCGFVSCRRTVPSLFLLADQTGELVHTCLFSEHGRHNILNGVFRRTGKRASTNLDFDRKGQVACAFY